MPVIKIAGYVLVDVLATEWCFCVDVVLDAKHVGGKADELAHVLYALVAREERGAVVAKVVVVQAFHFFAFRCGVTLDYSFVALIGNVLTDAILVVGDKDALAVTTVFGVELHGGVEGSARACEEVEDGNIFIFKTI